MFYRYGKTKLLLNSREDRFVDLGIFLWYADGKMFNTGQIEKLSDLFMDVAKGLFLGSFALSALTAVDLLVFVKGFTGGIVCTYFSLMLLSIKGARNE